MNNKAKSKNSRNKIYFRIMAILLSLSLFIFLEIILRLFSVGTDLHLFVEHKSEKYSDYYIVNPYVGEKYFTRLEATSGTNDIFLKKKPKNGFRIFLMGSSTLYGFPYGKNLMASRILQKRLQDSYPDKTIEVINTAITAINTITLKDYIGQILKYEPDAILFYAGHNEFYGAFGVGSNETMSKNSFLRWLHFKLLNLRIYQLLRSAVTGISNKIAENSNTPETKGTLMKRIVKNKNIGYKSAKYFNGINQFRNNLLYIVKQSQKSNVPFLLSDLVSNIKDLPPFGDLANSEFSAATKYNEAINALSNGDTLSAKKLFYEAKDFDPVRFRASEEINQIIDSLAQQNNVFFIPTKKWFSTISEGGLIGNNLLAEHVHPNINGQFVLADAFYTQIVESKLIDATPDFLTVKPKSYYRQNWGYTALDSLVGEYKIKQLKSYWPFTKLDSKITFRDTFKTSGLVDSLAFTVVTSPDADIELLHNYLGEHYEKNNQFYLAFKEYDALVNINPGRSAYYNKAANCLLKLDDLYAAEKYLKKSVKFIDTYFAHSMLGEIEFIKHDYQAAIASYNRALKLAGTDNVDKETKIKLLIKLNQAYYLNRDLNSMNAVQNMLSELGYKGNLQVVQKQKFEYSGYIPQNIKENYEKAVSYSTTNTDSTLYYLSECLKTNDAPVVNLFIGNIYYEKHDKRVLFFYNKAYDAYRKDPDFLVKLCVANLVNKNRQQAKTVLNELIKIAPSHTDIPQLKAALR